MMKHLAILGAALAPVPALAHTAGPVLHAHPHGIDSVAALVLGLSAIGLALYLGLRR